MAKRIRVALVGQPNVGKSSLLKRLTGGDARVGNWSGITVDKVSGLVRYGDYEIEFVDLPGVYSLSPYSPEERITRDYLLFERPDVVVNVVESPMLERNLFLTSQVLELEIPTVLALNMWDEFRSKGFELDLKTLERELGVRAVPVVGKTGENLDLLLEKVVEVYEGSQKPKPFRFSRVLEALLGKVERKLRGEPFYELLPKRWLAVKALEGDPLLTELLKTRFGFNLGSCCAAERHYAAEAYSMPPEEAISEERYRAIARLVSRVLKKPASGGFSFQEALDAVFLNPYLGLPSFFLIMFLVFKFTFAVSAPFVGWLDGFVNDFLKKYALYGLQAVEAPEWLASFVVDGIVGGVGFLLTFVPILVFMYAAIGFLEHSGYFARAAFVADRLMRPLGLTGKSVVPMILGFGCNVPAVLATRTLENSYLRRLTALLIPFMSCSARLPVYALLAFAFFPDKAHFVIFSMYLLGIFAAVLVAFLLRRTPLFGKRVELPFVVEIPPYRLPSFRELLRSLWTPVWEFVHRAGTVIFLANLAVWVLLNVPYGAPPKETLLGKTASLVQPALEPLGFGRYWENAAVLIPGFLAKELIITSYGTILGVQEEERKVVKVDFWRDLTKQIRNLGKAFADAVRAFFGLLVPGLPEVELAPASVVEKIKQLFTPASALAFMVFVLLYTPCAATVATLWQEFGPFLAAFSILLNLSTAWTFSFLTFQIARLIF
ncbi:MAG: ferrous iron transport protein B [Aquificae bacterium]|nr:ferrous iron transport protein B [Aquificota bacterium]